MSKLDLRRLLPEIGQLTLLTSLDLSGNKQEIKDSMLGKTLTNCTNTIGNQPEGKQRERLQRVDDEVRALIAKLPPDKQTKAVGNLELAINGVTSDSPERPWYDVSAKGLLEASKFVKDFTGNIAGTLRQLGKLLWPDVKLPGGRKPCRIAR